jgi:hypothetical protein
MRNTNYSNKQPIAIGIRSGGVYGPMLYSHKEQLLPHSPLPNFGKEKEFEDHIVGKCEEIKKEKNKES